MPANATPTKIALFTGSFDPVTKGHLDIINRANKLFDILYVGIMANTSKETYFSIDQRRRMLDEATKDLPKVCVITAQKELTVDLARRLRATYLLRSIRSSQDVPYEASLTYFNSQLASELETIYLLTRPELQHISSSRVRELLHFGADIAPYVPSSVLKEVENHRAKA